MNSYDAGIDLVNALEARIATACETTLEYLHSELDKGVSDLVVAPKIELLASLYRSSNWAAIAGFLPGRTLSDTVFKSSVVEIAESLGHTVRHDDCASHDTVECGRRIEYKAARPSRAGITVCNTGSSRRVSVDVLVADGPKVADFAVLTLDHATIKRFGSRYGAEGWQLRTSREQLGDLESLGSSVYALDEYLDYREDRCDSYHG